MGRALLVCLLPGLLVGCGDDPPTGPLAYHVTHYDYTYDVETRAAHANVTLKVDQGGDCFDIPFRADAPANTTINGDSVSAAADETKLQVCGSGYETGSEIELGIDLTIKLATVGGSQVGYSVTKDNEGNSLYYLVSWIGGCDQFGPCDSRPDQFATYKFTITHPAGYKTRCPGTITEPSGTQTVCDFTLPGGPTYSTFGVATYPAWTEKDKGTWGGVKVTLYDRASTLIDAAIDPAWHDGFLGWMQSTFGPYPFGSELRVLTAPTFWSGFEHPGNIVLDDSLAKTTRPRYWSETAHVLDHEIVHQWAGDQTTLKDTYDFVWKEAMAEYLTYVYEDMQDPAKALQTARYWKSAAQSAAYFPVPGDKPALIAYYGDVYGAGPMILFHQIEGMYGRDKVIAALQMVLGKAHAIGVSDVIAALEQSTGASLADYAAAWVHGSGAPDWPKYNVTFTPGTTEGTLTLTMMNKKAKPRGCMFKVALEGANTGESYLIDVDTRTNEDQTRTVPQLGFTVTKVTLDPYAECLVYKASGTPRVIRQNPWVSEGH